MIAEAEAAEAGPGAAEAAAAAHGVWLKHDAAAEEAANLMDEISSDASAEPTRTDACDSKMVALAAMALVTTIVMAPKAGTGPYLLFVATLTAAFTREFARKMSTSTYTMKMSMSDYLVAMSSRFTPSSAPAPAVA